MIEHGDIYGIVILYNPDNNIVDNIKTYIKSVKKLYIYDNSSINNFHLFTKLNEDYNNIIYLSNGINDGISHAINQVCEELYQFNDSWLLTMDQDSFFEDDNIEDLFDFSGYHNHEIGIISPLHRTVLLKKKTDQDVIERMTVMTSGNLLNIAVHKNVGGFDEKYFIDCVDWEYGLKLNHNGFKVLQNTNVLLQHGLGEPTLVQNKITRKKKYMLNHSPIRRYYITRNKLLLSKQYAFIYPKKSWRYFKKIFTVDLINIIFYEKQKSEKIKFFFLGFRDFIISRFGRYEK